MPVILVKLVNLNIENFIEKNISKNFLLFYIHFLDKISAPGDNESNVPPEPGPDDERFKTFLFGDDGVPARDSLSKLSLDSEL